MLFSQTKKEVCFMDTDLQKAGKKTSSGLWTKDFTTITAGSAVSMLGNAMAGFAVSLFVLDYTGTPALYAVYLFLNTLPQLAAPLLAGPLMDRFSRRKTIYLLDFAASALYIVVGLLVFLDCFNFLLLAVFTLLIGAINSTYQVAFSSFYPLLISPGNFSKAYSVSSTLQTLSYVMIAAATFLYRAFGIAPLLLTNGLCFFIAALFETRISDVESRCARPASPYRLSGFLSDSREGFRYLRREKGLLIITLAFSLCSLAWGASSVLTLPWFRANRPSGELAYMKVWGFMVIGRVLGNLLQYKWRRPASQKFDIAMACCLLGLALEGSYLFAPVSVMQLLCFLIGIFNGCSNNTRVSATQSYVPAEKQGRFNGAVLTLSTVGTLSGELLAGAALSLFSMRDALALLMGAAAVLVLLLLCLGRRAVRPIYNRET
jgi:MFS family permease